MVKELNVELSVRANSGPGIWFLSPPSLWGRDYRPKAFLNEAKPEPKPDRSYDLDGGVAQIHIRGLMVRGTYWYDEIDPDLVSRSIREAANDQDANQILLRIDSPGGTVDGVHELAQTITAAKAVKPVIAQVEGMAGSAAYWVASQASKIFAGQLDRVGSIGVYSLVPDDVKYWENMGIKWHLITTGEHKGAGETGQPISEDHLEEYARIVKTYFDAFKGAVKAGRGMSATQIKTVSDGRVFIGKEAVDLGLVDRLQSTDQTMAMLMKSSRDRASRARAIWRLNITAQSGGGGDHLTKADAEPDANSQTTEGN